MWKICVIMIISIPKIIVILRVNDHNLVLCNAWMYNLPPRTGYKLCCYNLPPRTLARVYISCNLI